MRVSNHREHPYTAAVIAAAGVSRRMGSDKLFAGLGGVPVLLRTLAAFEASDRIDEIVVVARQERIAELYALVRESGLRKLRTIAAGGETRTASVQNGVAAVSEKTELLCIHDGARPFVSEALIARVLEDAALWGAATAALPAKNTIKTADAQGFVAATPPRDTLWEIQTPQCFRLALYREAMRRFPGEYTDDCAPVEALGERVRLTEGDRRNIKLTTPEDLLAAQAFLEAEEEI